MRLPQSIHRWIAQKQGGRLEALPFEELQNRYEKDPTGIYREFVRRLHKLVFFAAEDFLRRKGCGLDKNDIEELAVSVFEDFGPAFGIGEPIMLLVRFAFAIRRVLDQDAFVMIATFYYKLLPAYHVSDDDERRFLVGAYQEALGNKDGRAIDEVLAERFETTNAKAASLLRRANEHLEKVIRGEFESSELSQATEGYLP